MKSSFCQRCKVEGLPDPAIPNQWKCPKCGGVLIWQKVADCVEATDSVGMHGHSAETRDGLPVREVARHVAENGNSSGIDINRQSNSRPSELARTLHPTAPAPRDPEGERKRAEEQSVVELLLPTYNSLHGTAYREVASGDDARGDDVVAKSVNAPEPPIRFQITFADTDGKLRASISRGANYVASETEEAFLARAAQALERKMRAPDPEAILILDGAGVVTAPGTVECFCRQYSTMLETAPFREIWWVDPAPGGVIRRLSPHS